MVRRKTDHMRHCSCLHVLPDWAERWRASPLLLNQPEALFREVQRMLVGSPHLQHVDTHRQRILAKISIPDAHGHQYWHGKMPAFGHPRVMYQGTRLYVQQWLYLWSSPDAQLDPNKPLKRLCHDPLCISPLHHIFEPGVPTSDFTRVALWEQEHPRPWPGRPTKWDVSDRMGERCLAGHGAPYFRVYNPSKRTAYCAKCAATERAWLAERAKIEHAAESLATGIPHRAPNEPTINRYAPPRSPEPEPSPEWDGPTLADQVAALNEETSP